MVIDQVISLVLVAQQYFLSLCRYIALNVKRLGSLTFSESRDKHEVRRQNGVNWKSDSDRKQSHGRKRLKQISEIPGPKCMPIFGSLFEFSKFGSRRVHELSKVRHEEYGDIFREKLLSQEMVFVANTELLKQWMSQEGKMPSSLTQEPSLLFAELYPELKRGLFFRNGEEWYKLRKLSHAILGRNAVEFDLQGLFDACQDFMVGFLESIKETCTDGKGAVDVERLGYDVAVGALIAVCYGKHGEKFLDYTGVSIKTLVDNALEINQKHQQLLETPARIAKWFGLEKWTTFHTKLRQNLDACIKFGQLLRDDIKKNPDACSMRSHGMLFKTVFWDADTRDVDDLLADFAVDTKDPFAGTTMFLTLILAAYPDVQAKILEEVNRVYPDNQHITYGKLKELEYTEAFFREVLRLYPVAAFTTRVPLEDTTLGEYQIPPGTLLLFSTWVIQRDPRYFSDPDKLIPERWLKNDEASQGDNVKCDSKAFGAFGLGQRICIGQFIAVSINVMYLANLVRMYKLHYDGHPDVEMQTVLYPKNPKPIRVEIRN